MSEDSNAQPTICPQCGTENDPLRSYCSKCGKQLRANDSAGTIILRVMMVILSVVIALPLAIFGGCVVFFSVSGGPNNPYIDLLAGSLMGLAALAIAGGILYLTVRSFKSER